MSAPIWANVCLVVLTVCGSGFGADAPAEQTLVVFLTADSTIAVPVRTAMQAEVAALMRPASIGVLWRDTATERGGIQASHAIVVQFLGSCAVPQIPQRNGAEALGPKPLATSPMADGSILAFSRIDCRTLNTYLGPSLAQLPAARRPFLYGRAAGRLVAHELYHVLTGSAGHAQTGIAKPAFTRSELLSDHFEFGPDELARLQPPTEPGPAFEDTGK